MNHLILNLLLQVSAVTTGTMTYKDAYEQAEKTGQPLVVLVGADWCPACQAMKQSVIPQLARKGILTKVSFATVNTDHDQALAGRLMRGGMIPQLVIYRKTAAGWQRQQLTGAQSFESAPASSPCPRPKSSKFQRIKPSRSGEPPCSRKVCSYVFASRGPSRRLAQQKRRSAGTIASSGRPGGLQLRFRAIRSRHSQPPLGGAIPCPSPASPAVPQGRRQFAGRLETIARVLG